MRKSLLGAAFVVWVAAAAPAAADHGHRDVSIDRREHRLATRIENGWRLGELTRREYRQLRHELEDFHRAEQFFRSDGRLTPHERGELHARLDHLAREIYRQRHDAQHRSYGHYGYEPGSYNRDHYVDRRF